MSGSLTPEEKKTIVEQHLKTLSFAEYGLTLSLSEANASSNKNQAKVDDLQAQAQDIAAQKSVLLVELQNVEAEIAAETAQG